MHRVVISTNVSGIMNDIGLLADTSKLASRAFSSICATLAAAVTNVFKQQGIPPWEPLSDVTLYERARLGFGSGPIMYRTGSLLASMTGSNEFHIQRLHATFRESTIIFGSEDPRAVPLGRGSAIDHIPARPMFPPGVVLHPELQDSIVAYAKGVVG